MKNTLIKWMTAGLTSFVFAGTAIANDSELKATTDTSRNPLTGTVTEKSTFKDKKAHADGSKTSKETSEKKKYKTDGSVDIKKKSETSVQSGE